MNEQFDSGLPRILNTEVRKLKAVITLIIYGLLLVLLKTMYDTVVSVPKPSIVAIIIILAFMLVFIVLMFNRFSRRAIQKITEYADAIQEARLYAESIVDSVPNPLLVMDADLRLRTANPAFHQRFGSPKEQTAGQYLFELDDGRWDLPELRARLERRENGFLDFQQLELEFDDQRVGHCHLLVGGRNVIVDGVPLYLLSLADVTARKMAENALKERTLELEVVNRAKSEFLANMSHELRTPLNAIIGFSEVLKDGLVEGELSSRQKEYVTDIFSSGKHLLSLINDILDLSKIESGKMSLDLELADVSGLCQSAGRIIKEKAAAHGISLAFNVPADLDAIYLDIRKFRQIAYNLLSNAVKFTPDGGNVTLTAKRISTAMMFKTFPAAAPRWQGEYFLKVDVEDTGIGISEEDQTRLFQPFEQIDGSLSRKYEGTGLGLTMVKRLAELHGGWVTVFSRKGEGSRFSVFLPWRHEPKAAAAKDTPSPSPRESAPGPVTSPSRFLLISRQLQLAEKITHLAQQAGIFVETMPSYGRAWEYLNKNNPPAVILDVAYPDLDGIRMLIQIKGLSRFQSLPVVLLVNAPEGDQAAVLAPSAISLSPLPAELLVHLQKRLGLHAQVSRTPPRAMLVEADAAKSRPSIEVLSGLGWNVEHKQSGLAGVDGMVSNVPDLLLVGATQPDISGFELLQLCDERPETRTVPVVMLIDPQTIDRDLAEMRKGLYAVLKPGGIQAADFQRVLSKLIEQTNHENTAN